MPYETRQSSQWQYQLSDFLREMAEWKPEHEASRPDYFHQKCRLFNELLELAPNSDMRLRMLDEYMAFLEQNRFECESFIEWFHHVSDLLRRIHSMREEERNLSLDFSLLGDTMKLESYSISGSQRYFWSVPQHFLVKADIH